MFFRLPKALALALSTSIATASFVSTQDKAQGQVVLGSEGATTARARDVDELGRQTYDGYSVVRFDVDSENKRQELVKLGQLLNLDIWAHRKDFMDILLPQTLPSFSPTFSTASSRLLSFSAKPFIPSIQPLISATYPSTSSSSSSPLWAGRHRKSHPTLPTSPPSPGANDTRLPLESDFHNSYHRLEDIYKFMEDLKEGWPELIEILPIGNSSEGREIKGIRIGEPPLEEDEDVGEGMVVQRKGKKHKKPRGGRKKEFVVIGGQHGREWISPSSTLYFAHWLLVNSASKDAVKHLLKHLDFTIIPVVNVDGYEFTFEKSRLWRKTRSSSGSTLGCRGIDPNRGWGYQWSASDEFGAGPCSENYPGKFPFEAPEVAAVAHYLDSQRVLAFIDIHSYGQLLMFPFSYSCDRFPPDAEDLVEALLGATKSLRSVRGTDYMTGQACELVFRAPGDSIDFAYGEQDIKWSFSMELPDEGTYAFLLPPREIRPVGEETAEALFYLAKFVERKENKGKFL